ncbi:amino acid permease-domain-containing protein [Truncatella angustata]|uniref:Amino acid permease-domain-containing protein n=1 Tax=Truncatella angustata TaxID=152316 RepID=A0A9P8ZU32_9PEZI|nr:amino acid permease-domain-containing protein [Truncatella angustata]KAH6651539.1 amino acid permease-domain-containing protein [Truncatella angustata]
MTHKFKMEEYENKIGAADPLRLSTDLARQTTVNTDVAALRAAGYDQELDRTFSLPAMGCLCLCLMATWEALSTVVSAALVSGGPPCLFYNYVLSFLCTLAITCSLAEIASIYPTAGGQYYWVAALSPPSGRRFMSYFTGWTSVGAQMVFAASAAFAAGLQTQSLIILNDESYIPERWQGMLFYWAIVIYSGVLNIWGPKSLPQMNIVAGVIHVAGFLAILIVLIALAPKNSASFVFTEFSNNSGWESSGASWLVGLLSSVYPFLGYDAACHLSEEIPHAARNVPIAMVGSVAVNGILGLAYCIVLLYSISSLDDILSTPTGFPFMQIYQTVTQSQAGTTIMSLLIIIIAATANVACVASASRTAWAFARDKALPYHVFFSEVSKKHQVPGRCVALVTFVQILLGFIYLGNTTAFNAILSMAIIGLYLSYTLPIIYMLFWGRKKTHSTHWGPFKLGKPLGVILNLISIIWMGLVMVVSTFPSMMPLTPQNMNYSSVVMAAWLLFGFVYYHLYGKKKYDVPVVHVSVVTSLSIATIPINA